MRLTVRLATIAAAALLAAAAAAGAFVGRGGGAASPAPIVLAAASLSDALPAIDPHARYSFAGSNTVAAQLAVGAPADVLVAANTSIPARLHAKGLVEQPIRFAGNTLVVVVPRSNPAGIRSLHDLARPGVAVAVAAPAVPVGDYTRRTLANLGFGGRVLANVVSEEADVRGVLAKVALGQADAGFVYRSDARAAARRVRVVAVPTRAQPRVSYALAVVVGAPHPDAARAFVARVLGARGQAVLAKQGFEPAAAEAARRPLGATPR